MHSGKRDIFLVESVNSLNTYFMYVITKYSGGTVLNYFDIEYAVILKNESIRYEIIIFATRSCVIIQILPNVYDHKQPINSETNLSILRFGGSCHSFYLFCLFHTFIITIIQYIFIHIHSPRPSLLFLHCLFAQREKPLWGAEPGFELGLAIQQASALPNEPFA